VTGDDQKLLTTQYTARAVSFIDRIAERPFFQYLAHSMVHVPLFVPEKYDSKSGKGQFSDVIMEIDWSVGQVFEALKRNKLDQTTLRAKIRTNPVDEAGFLEDRYWERTALSMNPRICQGDQYSNELISFVNKTAFFAKAQVGKHS